MDYAVSDEMQASGRFFKSDRSSSARGVVTAWTARVADSLEMRRIDWLFVVLPTFVGAVLVACLYLTSLDVTVSSYFYSADDGRWPLARVEPWGWLYRQGCLPSLCLGIAGLAVGIAGGYVSQLKRFQRTGLFLALALVLGPGLMVNAVLKPNVGRPRPAETVPFGGPKQFAFLGGAIDGQTSKSFPSGHASMGFFLMTPALLYYRRRPILALGIFAGGAAYGTLVGVARIAQGAHFMSDVIASALCVYATGLMALAIIRLIETRPGKKFLAESVLDEPAPDILPFPTQPAEDGPRQREVRRAA